MMISSDGDAMKADTAPATAALPKRSMFVRSASDLRSTTVCMRRLVPNCDAVMGAMLTMFICGVGPGRAAARHTVGHMLCVHLRRPSACYTSATHVAGCMHHDAHAHVQ